MYNDIQKATKAMENGALIQIDNARKIELILPNGGQSTAETTSRSNMLITVNQEQTT